MKRVLFILDSLGQGGAQRQVVTVSRLMKERGADVTVMCYGTQDFFYSLLIESYVRVEWIREQRPLYRIIKVRRFVRKGHYDAVVSFLHTENILNVLSSFGGHHWKVICGERSAKEETFETRRGITHGFLMRFSDCIVCNSENARQMWLRHYPKYVNKLQVIYNSVKLGEVKTSYLPLKDGHLNVVVAASYQYLKNPINLTKALGMLTDEQRSKIQVNWYGRREVVKGDTRAYDETVALIRDLNLQETFHLHEESSDILDIMNGADVIALLSRVEGLPNCICEGMMLGKTIMMTRVSDYNILVDEANGVLCDWDSPFSIKQALEHLINKDLNEIQEMGQKSQTKAMRLFSQRDVISKWLELIG